MKYNQPFDQPSSPNAPYVDGNPSAGIQGSIVPAAAVEYPQREVVNAITDTNLLNPDNADLRQLGRAIQSGRLKYAVDQGIQNNLSIVLSPVLISYFDGLRVYVRAAYNNNGSAQLAVGGLGFRQIVRRDLTQLKAGDIIAGAIHEFIYDAAHSVWQLMNVSLGENAGFLTQNITLYVNWNTGNDNNDGTLAVQTPAVGPYAGPLKNIQKAVDIAYSYPASRFTITVYVADSPNYLGFYTPYWSGPNVHIVGNIANPQNVVVTGQNSHAMLLSGVNTMTVEGITATTTFNAAGPGGGFICSNGSTLFSYNNRNLYVTGAVFEASGAYLVIGKHRFAGNCGEFYWAGFIGSVGIIDNDPNNTGSPQHVSDQTVETSLTASYATALASSCSQMSFLGGSKAPVWVNPGNVSGRRYYCTLNGTISTGTGTAPPNFFPGSSAGNVDTGGQYI